MKITAFRIIREIFFTLGFSNVWNRVILPYGMSSEALKAIPRRESRTFQVVGVPRSGTTLLATRLDNHPNLICLVEPYLSWLQRGYFEYNGKLSDLNMQKDQCNRPPHRLISQLCQHGIDLVGFKETFRQSKENPHFPPTKSFIIRNQREKCVDVTIAILRDPRDVWASAVEMANRSRLEISFDESIPDWILCSQWILDNSVFFVRYEDLVLKPEQTWQSIGDHLALELFPDILTTARKKGSGDARAQQGGGVFVSSVGRYRDDLPIQDQEYIHAHCGGWMDRLGYR